MENGFSKNNDQKFGQTEDAVPPFFIFVKKKLVTVGLIAFTVFLRLLLLDKENKQKVVDWDINLPDQEKRHLVVSLATELILYA